MLLDQLKPNVIVRGPIFPEPYKVGICSGTAAIPRKFDSMSGLPSGMKEQTLADYDANEARGFDQNMTKNLLINEQAKQGAAALLTCSPILSLLRSG
jgi:hypothetical protein